jgi:hypothetical protein
MAEVAGLVIGGVSLAGLFTCCVDCFEYVQIGRQFGDRYGRCLLDTRVLKLRLSRWAAAVNKLQPAASKENIETVKEILGDIINLFAEAEKISKDFDTKVKSSGKQSLVPFDTTELEPETAAISQKLQQLALDRQGRTSFVKKTEWALYKHRQFDDLIEDVTKHVESLEALFALESFLQPLRQEDAQVVGNGPVIELLEESVEETDPIFGKVVAEVVQAKGHVYRGNKAGDDAQAQYGDQVASGFQGTAAGGDHEYQQNEASQRAKVLYGNSYGGKSVFD